MAEWLRLRALKENGLNIRRICQVRIPLPKKSTGEGWCLVTSPCNCGRRKPNFRGSRMAEWLRLRALEKNGLNIRRICRVRIPLPKKSTGEGWCLVTSPCNCGRRKPIFSGQQDGRVVMAPSFGGERTKYTPDMPGSNSAAKKVHRGGLVPSHVPL